MSPSPFVKVISTFPSSETMSVREYSRGTKEGYDASMPLCIAATRRERSGIDWFAQKKMTATTAEEQIRAMMMCFRVKTERGFRDFSVDFMRETEWSAESIAASRALGEEFFVEVGDFGDLVGFWTESGTREDVWGDEAGREDGVTLTEIGVEIGTCLASGDLTYFLLRVVERWTRRCVEFVVLLFIFPRFFSILTLSGINVQELFLWYNGMYE